jgi:ribulose-phosphate 3-epimerase
MLAGTAERVRELKSYADIHNPDLQISVDGGVTKENAAPLHEAGASVLVAGSSVFGTKDYGQAIAEIRNKH